MASIKYVSKTNFKKWFGLQRRHIKEHYCFRVGISGKPTDLLTKISNYLFFMVNKYVYKNVYNIFNFTETHIHVLGILCNTNRGVGFNHVFIRSSLLCCGRENGVLDRKEWEIYKYFAFSRALIARFDRLRIHLVGSWWKGVG